MACFDIICQLAASVTLSSSLNNSIRIVYISVHIYDKQLTELLKMIFTLSPGSKPKTTMVQIPFSIATRLLCEHLAGINCGYKTSLHSLLLEARTPIVWSWGHDHYKIHFRFSIYKRLRVVWWDQRRLVLISSGVAYFGRGSPLSCSIGIVIYLD